MIKESINKTDDSQANKNRKRPRDRKSDCESILSGEWLLDMQIVQYIMDCL